MARRERWYFAKEDLENSPSRKCGIDAEKELFYRQQAANLIQDMGQKLKVTQLVINTAIVYMHRFYTFHSFTKFHRNAISACALFLAAKVEEQPRKLEHIIKVSQICIFRENVDVKSEQYQSLAAQLVYNENLMLRTLGFDLSVQHPHTSIVNCCQLVRATKYIAETSYYLATNSLHLSTLCLQYKPTVVACICIYFVCKWSSFQFAKSTEGKDWWTYVDQTVNKDMLEQLMSECVAIFQKCPQRLKKCLTANMKNNNKLPNNPLMRQIKLPGNKKADTSKSSTSSDSVPTAAAAPSALNSILGSITETMKPNSVPSITPRSATATEKFSLLDNSSKSLLNASSVANHSLETSGVSSDAHKKDLMPELKMEFSDNEDSNLSDNNISLASTLMMNDSNDSKSLSFSGKAPYETYDFKPNFSQLSEFSNSMSSRIDPSHAASINALFSNSDPKFPNSSLLFPSHQAKSGDEFPEFSLKNDHPHSAVEKHSSLSNNQKFLGNKKAETSKSGISSDSALVPTTTTAAAPSALNSILSSITDVKPNSAFNSIVPSIAAKSATATEKFSLLDNSTKSLLNASSVANHSLETSVVASDGDSSDYSKQRHKKKHKHKEKHKHKDKHKHKHKHKEKDKEKRREKYNVESSFQVEQPEKVAPLKLKISKQKLDLGGAQNADEEKKQPLKIKISLSNHQRSSSESPSNTELPVSRKRKHEDKVKPEKAAKLAFDHLSTTTDLYNYTGKLGKKA